MTRVGFVGLGLIGARRLRVARAMGCEIAFAVDPDASRQAALALQDTPFCADVSLLPASATANVDVIFVAVPHDLILPLCLWAFGLGANVLCEKPMGLSLAQAQEIAAAALRADRKFSAGFNKRFLPGVNALHGLIARDAFGEIYQARIVMGHGGRPGMEKEWKLKRERAGGGALIDPGIHLVDLGRYLFSAPQVLSFDLKRRFWDVDVEDSCALRLQCGSTALSLDVSLTYWKNIFEIEVFGRDGYAKVVGRGGNYGDQTIEYVNRWFWNGDDRRMAQNFGAADPSFDLETQAFLRWVFGEKRDPALSTPEDGIEALRVVGQIYGQS